MTPAGFVDPMRPEDHFAQVAAVRASLLLGDRTEHHGCYPVRRPGGGWAAGAPVNAAHGAVLAMVARADQHRTGESPQ